MNYSIHIKEASKSRKKFLEAYIEDTKRGSAIIITSPAFKNAVERDVRLSNLLQKTSIFISCYEENKPFNFKKALSK